MPGAMDTQRRLFAEPDEASPVSLPGEAYWAARTGAAASFAAGRVRGLEILDVHTGEVAGRSALVAAAADVVALDRAIARGTTAAFPFPDGCFDAVVALDIIGHEHAPREFVAESLRVLRRPGALILSAPNRHTAPRNAFGRFEVGRKELTALLAPTFDRVEVAGVFHGPRLTRTERLHRTSLPERLVGDPAPDWPRWISRVVARTTRSDFKIESEGLETALDLVAVAQLG